MMTGLVYIASPYAGDVEANLTFAGQAGRYCMMQGGIPMIPHMMYPAFLDDTDPAQRGLGIEMGLRLMEVCDCVWIWGAYIRRNEAGTGFCQWDWEGGEVRGTG